MTDTTKTARKHRKHYGSAQPTRRSPDQLADKAQLLKTVRELRDQDFTAQEIADRIGFSKPYTYNLLMQAGNMRSPATKAQVKRRCENRTAGQNENVANE